MNKLNIINLEQSKKDFEEYEGETNNFKLCFKSILGFDMILSAYIPIIIFFVINSYYNLTYAYIASFIWSVFCQGFYWLFKKIFDPVSLLVLFYSGCKLLLLFFIPVSILMSYSSIFESLVYCIVIIFFNIINKPIIQIFAEKINPSLLHWQFKKNLLYTKVWKETSNIWIIALILKAAIIYFSFLYLTPKNLGTVYTILGTPLAILLILIWVWYPKYRWIKILYKKQK